LTKLQKTPIHAHLLERILARQFPRDYHPDLTADRLIRVAQCIELGRNDALDRHNEAIGDNGWTLGCSAFQSPASACWS
jgi:hypothetical protein